MARKIFSSRGDEDLIDISGLQDFVFLVHDVTGNPNEPADNPEDLMQQLDIGLVEMAGIVDTMHRALAVSALDILSLTLNVSKMVSELKLAVHVLESLAHAPTDDEPFKKALAVLKHEGAPEVRVVPIGGSDSIELDVELAFTEDNLAEALRVAISTYVDAQTQIALDSI